MRRAFRPALLNLEVRSLLSGTATGSPPADYSDGPTGDPGSNPAGGSGSTGGYGSSSGDGSTGDSGSGSGSGSGYGSGLGGGSYVPMPSGLGDDLALINQYASPDTRNLAWDTLVLGSGSIAGNAPWGHPTDFTSRDPYSNTWTSSYGGLTTTTVEDATYTASYEGSGDGSWEGSVVSHTDYTATTTGTDDAGRSVNAVATKTYDLNWQGSGDSSGTGTYKVQLDQTEGTTEDHSGANGDPYKSHDGFSAETHMMAEGEEGPDGTISGQFTLKGDLGTEFSLNDSSGDPASSAAGYAVNYATMSSLVLNEAGSLVPDDSNQASIDVKDSESGSVVTFDGNGGLDGATRGDFNEVQTSYDAAGNATPGGQGGGSDGTSDAKSAAGPPASQGPVNVNGPLTELNVPKGKAVAYVVDMNDKGWDEWTEADKERYRRDNNLPPGSQNVISGGAKIKEALSPLQGPLFGATSLGQITKDLDSATRPLGGKLDVLVIGDHGGAGRQQLGDPTSPYVTPEIVPDVLGNPTAADQLVAFLKPGGTLILTGCHVLGDAGKDGGNLQAAQQVINDWQAYATARGITIIGSVSYTAAKRTDTFRGIWVTLVPGGNAPQLTTN